MPYRSLTFLNLFNLWCGNTEIPRGYLGWSGISLIAAILQNNVWYEKFKGDKLTPNLFIFLVGPASIGKGSAISKAVKLLNLGEISVNLFRGKTTAAFLLDLLGKPLEKNGEICPPDNRLYLIMDELANDLGQVKQADDFIKMMTEMFTATDYPLNTGTRTDGYVSITNPCINWLVGTTKEWLFDVMTRQTIYSGFTARVLFCFRDYVDLRIARPLPPDNYDALTHALITKIRVLSSLEGEMIMDDKTKEMHDDWYDNRKVPDESLLIPAWKRGHDLVLKLAMIFSLDENPAMVIRRHHLRKAITTFDNAFDDLGILINLACGTAESEEIDILTEYLSKNKQVNRTKLTRALWHRKIRAKRVDSYIEELRDRALVQVDTMPGGGKLYTWLGD